MHMFCASCANENICVRKQPCVEPCCCMVAGTVTAPCVTCFRTASCAGRCPLSKRSWDSGLAAAGAIGDASQSGVGVTSHAPSRRPVVGATSDGVLCQQTLHRQCRCRFGDRRLSSAPLRLSSLGCQSARSLSVREPSWRLSRRRLSWCTSSRLQQSHKVSTTCRQGDSSPLTCGEAGGA